MESAAIGDHRLIASLGRGGMAEVFLATRQRVAGFHKLVVIKRLRTDLLAQPQAAKYRALLLDEARLAARLRHPNIVQTFEVGDQHDQPFLAMEYLDGQPLSHVVAKARRAGRPLPTSIALQIVADVLGALVYAHDLADYDGTPLGIVHRDVSPQNIFWTYDGEIKLVDFGVAKFALNTDETEAGVVKGKLTYMAPEQARGLAVDRRADVFVTGIVLWELMSGRRLLLAPSQAASMQRLLFEELPSLSQIRPDLDPAIARICDHALERERDRRYPTAADMLAELELALAGHAPRRNDLAAFIQPLFVEERAAMSHRIRDALAGDRDLVSLSSPDLLSSKDSDAVATSQSMQVAEPVRSVTQPHPHERRSHRRQWLLGLGIAAVAVIAADVLLLSEPRPDDTTPASPAPPPALPAVATPAPPAPAPPDLRLCGSNTVGAELGLALVEAFLKRKGAATVARATEPEHARLSARLLGGELVVDVRAAGTATAFEGIAAGTCDIGMASRAINDKEIQKLVGAGHGDLSSPATEHVIALDGIAVIVHPNNPLTTLDRNQLHDIFTGKLRDWSELGATPGPITVFARDARSGTFDTFKNLVLAGDALPAATRRFAESDVLADAVASDPSAIGFIGLAYVRSAKAIAVGDRGAPAMLPTSFTVTTENYMLSRRLYFYTTPRPRTPLVTELVSYALSPQGQAVVRDTNFVDLSVTLSDGNVCDARCPRTYASLVAHAQRISLDFRFRTGSEEIDSRATRDLDRVIQFIRGLPNAKLMLLGFSDSAGAQVANARLSRRRATTIAHELQIRGVRAAVIEGFGAAMPVAPNTTDADRQRNRRVEVWLELPR